MTHMFNTDGAPEVSVFAHTSTSEDDTLVIVIETALKHMLQIVVNGGDVGTLDRDGTFSAAPSDGSQHYIDTGLPLSRTLD